MASLLCLSPFLELKQLEDRLYHIPPLFLQFEGKSLTLLPPSDTTEFFLFFIVKLLKQLSGLTVSYSSLLIFFLEPTSARPTKKVDIKVTQDFLIFLVILTSQQPLTQLTTRSC